VFGDGYFRNNVGKALMYEQLRSTVMKQPWYTSSPGYLANIVAYAIARFSLQIESQFGGAKFDFGRVWQSQSIDQNTVTALLDFAHAAQLHLTDDNRPQANVTQWAKQQACWDRFARAHLELPATIQPSLVSAEDARSMARDDRKLRAMDTGFENVRRVMSVSQETWMAVYRVVQLSPLEADLVQLFGLQPGKVPSEKQAGALLRLLDRMAEAGAITRESF